MYDILYLFKGMLVGLMVSIPLGPMVLIIQKTLHKGALSGFIAGMGAASADFFYASVAAFGLGYVINTVQTHELLLQIIGGIFLLCIGLKIYFDNPIRQIRQRRQGRVSKTGLLGDYLSLFS
ncbi:MAG: LysE family translocator [Butyricimonas faecihominis]